MTTIQEPSAKQTFRPNERERLVTKIVNLLQASRSEGGDHWASNKRIAFDILAAVNRVLLDRTDPASDMPRTKEELMQAITNQSLARSGDPRRARERERPLFDAGVKMLSEPTEIRKLVEIALQNPGWLGLPQDVSLSVSFSTLIRTVERMYADHQLPAAAEKTWREILPDMRRSQLG